MRTFTRTTTAQAAHTHRTPVQGDGKLLGGVRMHGIFQYIPSVHWYPWARARQHATVYWLCWHIEPTHPLAAAPGCRTHTYCQ
jgi:hypothetical protein